MSTVSKTYTFVAGTLIEAAEVNQNFDDVIGYINSEVIVRDASVPFTSIPTVPASSPTSDNQVARKKYVDDQDTTVSNSVTALGTTVTNLTTTVTNNNNAANTALALRTQATYVNGGNPTQTAVTTNPKIFVGIAQLTSDANGEATYNFTGFNNVYSATVSVGQGTSGPASVTLLGLTSSSISVRAYSDIIGLNPFTNQYYLTRWANAGFWVSFTILGN
jgi:hypothetical protein